MTARTTIAAITISTIAVVLIYGSFLGVTGGCAEGVPVARRPETREARAGDGVNVALRGGRTLVGGVQHFRPRDRILPPPRGSRPAGTRSRVRHGQASASVPPRRPRRRRFGRLR